MSEEHLKLKIVAKYCTIEEIQHIKRKNEIFGPWIKENKKQNI